MKNDKPRIAFFGTPQLAVMVLEELEKAGFTPTLIVTRPDAPAGRGKTLTPPLTKTWGQARSIEIAQPEKNNPAFIADLSAKGPWDVFVVAAYGKILPQGLLNIPRRGTLNVHPSLLPKLRGPSPIISAILTDDREVGVSVMLLDAEMDHGPLVAQETVKIKEWPPRASELEKTLAQAGGVLLAKNLIPWIDGEITAQPQDHSKATFCKMIQKEDGLLDLAADPYQNLLKIRAFEGWPGTYTFFKRGEMIIRTQIISAHLAEDVSLSIDTVRPEGKRDMPYADFVRSGAIPCPPPSQS